MKSFADGWFGPASAIFVTRVFDVAFHNVPSAVDVCISGVMLLVTLLIIAGGER